MEIEYKYQLNSGDAFTDILDYLATNTGYKISDISLIKMNSSYYDTHDMSLARAKAAFRLRQENINLVATIKFEISQKDGLYHREEYNQEASLSQIPPSLTSKQILDLTGIDLYKRGVLGSPQDVVEQICNICFDRQEATIDMDYSSVIISYDRGQINKQDGSSIPISELEIELSKGDINDLNSLAGLLIERFNLVEDPISKLAKAFL